MPVFSSFLSVHVILSLDGIPWWLVFWVNISMLLHQGLVFIFMLLVSILSVSVICCFKGVCRWFFFCFYFSFCFWGRFCYCLYGVWLRLKACYYLRVQICQGIWWQPWSWDFTSMEGGKHAWKYLPAALLDGFIVDFLVAFIFLGCLVCLENTFFGIHTLFSFKLWSFLVTLSFGWGALNKTSVKDL